MRPISWWPPWAARSPAQPMTEAVEQVLPALGHRPDPLGVLEALPELVEIPPATHWPSLSAADVGREWEELLAWVKALQARFAHLDHHVITPCWWRHNEVVEALVALRDHERVSFSDAAPATAPVEWFRALRDIGALLRSWTTELACGAAHQEPPIPLRPTDPEEWLSHVAADVERRGKGDQT